MISKLILIVPLVLASAPQAPSTPPPIKMGLWEATTTTGTGRTIKTRSCMTEQSYQEQFAHVPPNCTLSNFSRSATHMSGDVACKESNGQATTSGHFDAEFPDETSAQTTVTLQVNMQGRTMPMTIKSESHYVGADCRGISPGHSQLVH